MKPNWLSDARLIPDEIMSYLRKIAVNAVNEKGYSPEDVVDILGLSRRCIYDWMNRFREHGYDGLDTKKAPGAEPVVTKAMDDWLKETVLNSTPEDFGYDTNLWTCDLLAELLSKYDGVDVIGETVNHHLRNMDLSCQKPGYFPAEQDPEKVEPFLNVEFPKIQRFANKIGADIGFEDESAVDLREHSGKTWGARGETPKVFVTGKRGRYNILSVVTAKGELKYHVTEKRINSKESIQFLKQLLKGRKRPLILIADRASFHTSKAVRRFVCCHRKQIRLHYLPAYSPEHNPDEHVWEEIKDKRLGRQPIKNKLDLKKRLHSALRSLQQKIARVRSFFKLPETQYAA
ncbi:IS630 family transposase [uncultured Thiocystis sp.]|jgi:transposase|uniref:IS630 family transposase n=1 Tax=uncultured Thiocystis sp. TaxID=1202134 RepID=UPI0025FEB001|nr:IS630 family transposase [uncultured Thiocystis sp.]